MDVYVLDEEALTTEHVAGLFWDDAFNGMPHHAAISMWGRPPRSSLTDEHIPPIPPYQADPIEAPSRALLRTLRSLDPEKIQYIVLEPNGILWPGLIEDRERAYPRDFNFVTGDYASVFIGIHEALAHIRRLGVGIGIVSSCPKEALAQRWEIGTTYRTTVTMDDVDWLCHRSERESSLAGCLTDRGIVEESVLYIDVNGGAPKHFRGHRFCGDVWDLRRELLRAPTLLRPMDARTQQRRQHAEQAHPNRPVRANNALSFDELRLAVDQVLCTTLKCNQAALSETDDLRLLGLDSLGVTELFQLIEKDVGIRVPDHEIVEAVVFSREAILDAVAAAASAADVQTPHPNSNAQQIPFYQLDRDAFCSQDLPSIFRAHAEHSTVPWILKFVRSPSANDYEYIGWQRLYELATAYQHLYRSMGLRRGDVVMILKPPGLHLVASWMGAINSRLVPAISALPSEKLAPDAFYSWFFRLLEMSGTAGVICEPAIASELRNRAPSDIDLPPVMSDPPREGGEPIAVGTVDPDAPAILQFSSGTTGLKKGVVLSHRAILGQVWDLAHGLHLDPQDRIVSWLPLYHDMGLIGCLAQPLLTSTPIVMMSPFDWVRRPSMLLEQVSEEQGTLCWLPNFAYLHSAKRVTDAQMHGLDVSSLKAVVSSSEPVTRDAQQAFFQRFSAIGLRCSSLAASYGMAETTLAVTMSPIGRPCRTLVADRTALSKDKIIRPAGRNAPQTHLVSSGRPLAHADVEIVDESGCVQPTGKLGEIRVRAPYMMKEYLKQPELTKELVRDGWYYTGDEGAFFDDELYVTGRRKDIIIVSGENIYPHDVEEVVSEIDGIHAGRVVSFGVYDPEVGTEDLVVLAELEEQFPAHPGMRSDISARVKERVLSALGVMVSSLRLVGRQTLAKSTSGKLSRAKNRDLYLVGTFDWYQLVGDSQLTLPAGQTGNSTVVVRAGSEETEIDCDQALTPLFGWIAAQKGAFSIREAESAADIPAEAIQVTLSELAGIGLLERVS